MLCLQRSSCGRFCVSETSAFLDEASDQQDVEMNVHLRVWKSEIDHVSSQTKETNQICMIV
jgi:hypothetical protein